MSCDSNGRKALACVIRNGISAVAGKSACARTGPRHWGSPGEEGGSGQARLMSVFKWQQTVRSISPSGLKQIGLPAGLLAGALSGTALVGYALRRRKQTGRVKQGPGGAMYDAGRFDMKAAAASSDTFAGARAPVKTLLSAVGDRGQSGQVRPLVKMGGEDDLFVAEGARGHIAFSLPDGPNGDARIEGVIPKRGEELGGALDGRLPKYIIVDPETSERYATRNPDEARQFATALNEDPEEAVIPVWPGESEFDEAHKKVPAALFY